MPEPLRLPTLDIDLDGSRLPDRCARAFTSLRVHQNLSQPSVCELCFTGLEDGAAASALSLGASLRVAVQGVGTALFEGRISAIEYGYGAGRIGSVAIRAYDELFILRGRQSVRAHIGLTTAELAQELVADLGLTVEAESPGPAWPRVLQTGTDFDLLAEVAGRCGLHFTVQDGRLRLLTLKGWGEARPLRLNQNLIEARLEANSNGACRKVLVSGWDPWRSVERSGSASSARVGRSVNAQAPSSVVGGRDERSLLAATFQDDAQADAWAQAELDARSAQEVVFRGTALGDPRLRPGAKVEVIGVAPSLAGQYIIASARHTLDVDQGFLSELDTTPPPGRARARGTAMTLGHVTRIDDPERLGRIQVALPAYANLESDWLQLLAPGAGAGKGLVALPDIGDIVLLLVDLADPAQAVVLGSLYGEGGLPEGHDVFGKDASFCFLTPGGQRLRLDDGARSVRVENSHGSSIEMTPDAVKLHAKVPMTIEAPGQKILIRAQFIDFERA